MRRRLCALTTACAALAGAGTALGSNVSTFGGQIVFAGNLGEANNIVVSRSGDNFVIADSVPITINAGAACVAAGANTVNCAAADITRIIVASSDGNDTVLIDDSVTGVQTTLRAGPGADQVTGGNNTDDDIGDFVPDADGDVLLGRGGDDQLAGGNGPDVLNGGPGDDRLSGGLGNDNLDGGDGNDRLDEGSAPNGADAITGGPGQDSLSHGGRTAAVTVVLNGVADDGEAGEGDNVSTDVEGLSGGSGNDTFVGPASGDVSIFGGGGDDTVTGGSGNDRLFGGDGADTLSGAAGDDQLAGGEGPDVLDGGAGDDDFEPESDADDPDVYRGGPGTDRMSYAFANAAVTVTLDGAANDGVAAENDNVGTDVEDVVGSRFADTITGNASANELDGGAGNDTLVGGPGSDGLAGGRGDDTLDGGAQIDALEGGDGSDRIRARDGLGDDVSCGSGDDVALVDGADLPTACETSARGMTIRTSAVRAVSGRVTITIDCPVVEQVTCRGSLRIARGALLGSRSFAVPSGTTRRVTISLNRAGRAALLRARSVPAAVTARFVDATGVPVSTKRSVTIRR